MDRTDPEEGENAPRYRIQAVSERTGVSTATLRAWERRYGVPEPARTDARYRLYSERDIAMVRRVSGLCAVGLRPAEAARIALAESTKPAAMLVPPTPTRSQSTLVDRIVESIRVLDIEGLRAALDAAFSGNGAAETYETVIGPAMRIVGEKWSAGELSVAAEHAGSHVVRTLLANLVRLVTPPAPAPTALLACFGEEQHEIGLLGFALHVASWGYRPLYLGARTPPKALAEAIAAHRPAFVALSVVIAPPLEDARDLLRGYQRVLDDTPWIVGGPAAHEIADLVRRRGGHLAGPRQEDTRALVGRLLHPAVARHA